MGLMSFIKEAGEKLFGRGEAQAKEAPDPNATVRANQAAADAIVDYIRSMNLDAEGLSVAYDGEKSEVTVSGMAKDQQTKEKILLCCGNVAGVAKVNDDLSVTGLDQALKDLIKERPHLVRATTQDIDAGRGTGGSRTSGPSKSMNDIIRGKVRGE